MKSKSDKKNSFFYLGVILLSGLLLTSCEPTGENASDGENGGAEVITGGILEAVSVNLTNGEDLGEVVVGSGAVDIPIEITNNSNFSVQDISVSFEEDSLMGVEFATNSLGSAEFPGGEHLAVARHRVHPLLSSLQPLVRPEVSQQDGCARQARASRVEASSRRGL